MKFNQKIAQFQEYSTSKISSSLYSKGNNPDNNLDQGQKQKCIPQQLILYPFKKSIQEEQENLTFTEQDYQQLIRYILDYEQSLSNGGKKLFILEKGDYQDDFLQQYQDQPVVQILKKVIDKMYNGLNTALILQNCCLSGIHLLETINKIQEQYIDQRQEENENYRITLLNIISTNAQKTLLPSKTFSRILQSFNILIDQNINFNCSDLFIKKNCKQNNLLLQNQYFLPIHFNRQQQTIKVTSEIQNVYKYFLKQKIIQFKPKIILLGIEIDKTFELDSYFLQKIIHQLDKISQNSLIIFPIRMSNVNQERYWQTLVQCMNALNTYKQAKKNHIQDNDSVMKAKNYLSQIERVSQTHREKQYYKLQLSSLNAIQKIEQQNDNESQEIFKFPIMNTQNEIEYVILQDQKSEKLIEIDSDTKYYVSYLRQSDNKLTLSIIKDEKLYWGEINLNEIQIKNENEKRINLQQISVFLNNPNSSFLLDQYKFYQVTLDVNENDQFIGTVIIYNFEANQIKVDQFSVQNEETIKCHIKGFTVVKHSETSFSVLSGCIDGDLYQQIGIKLDFVEQNSLQLNQYYKQQNKLPKGYDNPLMVKFEPNQEQNLNQYLYFESQTKHYAIPLSPQLYKIFFSHQLNSCCNSETIQNVRNAHLLQQYSKLFRSDQINLKYQNYASSMILFELIVFDKTTERTNYKEFNDNNKDITLQKYSQQNYLHFQFYYSTNAQQSQIKIDLNIDSFLLKNRIANLNQRCLYNNWLEDQNFQYIFLFNRSQHIYLLYYQKDKSRQYSKKKFVFYYEENPKDYIPFDEVMINDYYNSRIWVVRKHYDRNQPYLVVYWCHWMRLQDIKDADINAQIKVKMDKLFEINFRSEVIDLIGLEIQKSDNTLLICTSTFVCKVPISKILNHLQYTQTTQIQQGKSLYEIYKTELNICHESPIIFLNLNENKIALFYQYCLVNSLDEKKGKYQIEIKAKIWFQKSRSEQNKTNNVFQNSIDDFMNQDDQEQTQDDQSLIKYSIEYQASKTLILAKLILLQLKGSLFQSLIFFEEGFSQFYIGLYQFFQDPNSIETLRMIQLPSYGTIQFLQSISTNKYETLFLYDQKAYLIHSESTLETFFTIQKKNDQTEVPNALEYEREHNYKKQEQQYLQEEEPKQKKYLLN